MDQINVILAPLSGRTVCTTKTVYQYNQGMVLKLLGIDLPQVYTVDFANSVTGSSISQVGNADGVTIPDQFFVPGSTIHAWFVAVGTGYSVTRYHIMIPISPRAARTNEEPTPSQQSAIDEAIAALNDAVDAAETAITHYPKVEGGYWYIWDVTAGEYVSTGVAAQGPQGDPGQDGVSPEISVAAITGGHRITITDANGTKTVDVMDGTDGDDGVGISSIVKTGTSGLVDTYTITYTDGITSTFTVTNGADGAPGFSPTVAITEIPGGHRITITDATGSHSADVMDGEGGVADVQVNGTSVVADGVANVPKATTSNLGVVYASYYGGVEINNNGRVMVSSPTSAIIKSGTETYISVTANKQHESAFYGLAKAAGADMKNVSGATVGIYPEDQKSAISQMLNAPVTVSGTTPAITALPGVRYICGEVATLDITLPASGCVDVVFESGSTPTVLTITPPTGVTVKWANGFDPTSLDANTTYEINIADGLGVAGSWT